MNWIGQWNRGCGMLFKRYPSPLGNCVFICNGIVTINKNYARIVESVRMDDFTGCLTPFSYLLALNPLNAQFPAVYRTVHFTFTS